MKQLKEIMLGLFVICAICFLVYYLLEYDKTRRNRELAKQIAELSPRGGPPETIEGLRQAIKLYEDQIERYARESAQTGVYWKILAVRLAERGMHNDALDALEKAIYYNAEDPALFHLTGVSAGIAAKSIVGFSGGADSQRDHFYRLSESSYLRALELDSSYSRPMYGIAVLYAFELNRPSEAIPYLLKFLEFQRNDISAMFVLARSYYLSSRFSEAIEVYERIIKTTKDAKIQAEASNNIEIIQRMRYE